MSPADPSVVVFGPSPMLIVAIERGVGDGDDDIHVHAGGQGVWVTRMVGEMGVKPTLCAYLGGESGNALRPLLEDLPGDLLLTETATGTNSWIVDHRSGEREAIAHQWSEPPSRHEVDHLFSETAAAALTADVLVLCGSIPPDAAPADLYAKLVKDASAGRAKVIVDLGTPKLDRALEGGPDLVHVNDWQLAGFVSGPVSEKAQLLQATRSILDAGAKAVVVTRGGEPGLVMTTDRAWELVPPRFEAGVPDGGGDSMVGAMAAALARGDSFEDVIRLGAAAGSANFLRRGLGSATRDVVEQVLPQVELRPLTL